MKFLKRDEVNVSSPHSTGLGHTITGPAYTVAVRRPSDGQLRTTVNAPDSKKAHKEFERMLRVAAVGDMVTLTGPGGRFIMQGTAK